MLSKHTFHLCKEIVKHSLTLISNERVYDYTLKKIIYILNYGNEILIICSDKFYFVAWMKNKGIEIGWKRKRVYENMKTYGMSNKSLSQLRKTTLSYFRRFFFTIFDGGLFCKE
jgi:hypothetical protein